MHRKLPPQRNHKCTTTFELFTPYQFFIIKLRTRQHCKHYFQPIHITHTLVLLKLHLVVGLHLFYRNAPPLNKKKTTSEFLYIIYTVFIYIYVFVCHHSSFVIPTKSLSVNHSWFTWLHKTKTGSFPPHDVCQNSPAVRKEESVFRVDFMVTFLVETLITNDCQLHSTLKRSTNKVTEKVHTFHRGITVGLRYDFSHKLLFQQVTPLYIILRFLTFPKLVILSANHV